MLPPSIETARAVVAGLVERGVAHACICPGSRSSPLVAALAPYDQRGVELTVHHDERSAAFFALGIARTTARPVALVCTSGSAPAHFLPAVIEAHHSNVPLVLLTADRPAELRDVGAPQATHQHRLFDGFTRWMVDTSSGPLNTARLAWLRRVGQRAATEAITPRPGPVHVNMPFDEPLLADPSDEITTLTAAGAPPDSTVASLGRAALDRLKVQLEGVRHPVVVAGYARFDADARAAIAELARRIDAPLLADPTSNLRGLGDSIDRHDAFLRSPKIAERLPCDAVIRFGAPPVSKALNRWIASRRLRAHVVVDPWSEWHEPLSIDTIFLKSSLFCCH